MDCKSLTTYGRSAFFPHSPWWWKIQRSRVRRAPPQESPEMLVGHLYSQQVIEQSHLGRHVASLASLRGPKKGRVSLPIGSMYGIYGNIYHQYTPNVSIYTIHGSYGLCSTQKCCVAMTHRKKNGFFCRSTLKWIYQLPSCYLLHSHGSHGP